jgi:hypothetical protein
MRNIDTLYSVIGKNPAGTNAIAYMQFRGIDLGAEQIAVVYSFVEDTVTTTYFMSLRPTSYPSCHLLVELSLQS